MKSIKLQWFSLILVCTTMLLFFKAQCAGYDTSSAPPNAVVVPSIAIVVPPNNSNTDSDSNFIDWNLNTKNFKDVISKMSDFFKKLLNNSSKNALSSNTVYLQAVANAINYFSTQGSKDVLKLVSLKNTLDDLLTKNYIIPYTGNIGDPETYIISGDISNNGAIIKNVVSGTIQKNPTNIMASSNNKYNSVTGTLKINNSIFSSIAFNNNEKADIELKSVLIYNKNDTNKKSLGTIEGTLHVDSTGHLYTGVNTKTFSDSLKGALTESNPPFNVNLTVAFNTLLEYTETVNYSKNKNKKYEQTIVHHPNFAGMGEGTIYGKITQCNMNKIFGSTFFNLKNVYTDYFNQLNANIDFINKALTTIQTDVANIPTAFDDIIKIPNESLNVNNVFPLGTNNLSLEEVMSLAMVIRTLNTNMLNVNDFSISAQGQGAYKNLGEVLKNVIRYINNSHQNFINNCASIIVQNLNVIKTVDKDDSTGIKPTLNSIKDAIKLSSDPIVQSTTVTY